LSLRSYLKDSGETLAAFGARLRHPKPPATVHRWATGENIPDREGMADIVEATGGAVRPDDFYQLPPALAAASGG
jgi:hypothetical protein